jgi:hypothetical protein
LAAAAARRDADDIGGLGVVAEEDAGVGSGAGAGELVLNIRS